MSANKCFLIFLPKNVIKKKKNFSTKLYGNFHNAYFCVSLFHHQKYGVIYELKTSFILQPWGRPRGPKWLKWDLSTYTTFAVQLTVAWQDSVTPSRLLIHVCCSSPFSLHVPEEHAEFPDGHGLFEHGHGTVPFGAAQQVHRALLDLTEFAAASHRRRSPRAGGSRRLRRRQRPDVRRARVERRRRVEGQRLGRRRPVHLAHFKRVVAVLQQAVRRAVQLYVIACGAHKIVKANYTLKIIYRNADCWLYELQKYVTVWNVCEIWVLQNLRGDICTIVLIGINRCLWFLFPSTWGIKYEKNTHFKKCVFLSIFLKVSVTFS